jgi:hypothetical protein
MFYINPDVKETETTWGIEYISDLILASRTYTPNAIGDAAAFWKH